MSTTKNNWINVIFLAVTLLINTLGALGVINGLSQKEISDMYMTLITPSPFTFSIWSVIYALLIISMVVITLKKDDLYYQNAHREISGLFRISCFVNAAWIVSFSFLQLELSVIFILGLVILLSLICLKLKTIQVGKHFLLPLTFGLYTGWLFVATVVNIAAALVKLKWDGFEFSNEMWAVVILIVSVVLAFGVLYKIRNAAFPLSIAWAYYGINQFLKAPEGFNGQFVLLQITSLVGMAVLIGLAAIQLYLNHYALIPQQPENQVQE